MFIRKKVNNSLLENITVMVTRPEPQGKMLCDKIQEAGGRAIFFPTIEIISLIHSPDFLKTTEELDKLVNLEKLDKSDKPNKSDESNQLDKLDWLIFVSAQAVYQMAKLIQERWSSFPFQVNVAAIGGGTALALKETGIPLHLYPHDQWGSEGLLSLPVFQNIKGKKIALVRGEGGRIFLAEELTRRGAKLTHVVVYKRSMPAISMDLSLYSSLLRDKKIDIIIGTSNDGLNNLNLLLGQGTQKIEAQSNLYTVPLVVISDRMAAFAKQVGFRTILLAKNASHDVIMAALKDYICRINQAKLK